MNDNDNDITIHFKDELKCYLECDRSIAIGIKDKFSFFAKGYKYHPKFKAGTWSGQISLYNLASKEFYVGLIPDLYKFAKETGYKIGFSEKDVKKFKPAVKFDNTFLTEVVPKIAKFPPKDYQIKYVEEALKWNKLAILSPTGSGKSYTMFLMLRYILINTDYKILINVPSITLVEQLFSDFKDYAIDGWDVDKEVTKVYGGQEEDPKARVVISTWQSCQSKPSSYYQQFDAYFCDEAHSASSKVLTKIIDNLSHATMRFGLTGTLDGTELHELEIIARFGRVFRVVTTADLMDSGDLADLNVNFLKLNYNAEDCKLVANDKVDYHQEIDFIINHKARNKLLIKLAMNQKKNTLMLFNFVEKHGKMLLTDLNEHADKNLKRIYFIYQKVKGDEREMIRKTLDGFDPCWYDITFEDDTFIRFKESDQITLKSGKTKFASEITILDQIDQVWLEDKILNGLNYKTAYKIQKIKKIVKQVGTNILLASYGTLAVGVNIKNLHTLIFCHPLKARIRTLQSIGRILRSADGKGAVKLIDIADNLCHTRRTKTQVNTTYKHFLERLKIYESEKFKYTITEFALD